MDNGGSADVAECGSLEDGVCVAGNVVNLVGLGEITGIQDDRREAEELEDASHVQRVAMGTAAPPTCSTGGGPRPLATCCAGHGKR